MTKSLQNRGLYDHLLPDTHRILIQGIKRMEINDNGVRIPPSPYSDWILEHKLDDTDWRIQSNDSLRQIIFIFRDPAVAMLFKLTFKGNADDR